MSDRDEKRLEDDVKLKSHTGDDDVDRTARLDLKSCFKEVIDGVKAAECQYEEEVTAWKLKSIADKKKIEELTSNFTSIGGTLQYVQTKDADGQFTGMKLLPVADKALFDGMVAREEKHKGQIDELNRKLASSQTLIAKEVQKSKSHEFQLSETQAKLADCEKKVEQLTSQIASLSESKRSVDQSDKKRLNSTIAANDVDEPIEQRLRSLVSFARGQEQAYANHVAQLESQLLAYRKKYEEQISAAMARFRFDEDDAASQLSLEAVFVQLRLESQIEKAIFERDSTKEVCSKQIVNYEEQVKTLLNVISSLEANPPSKVGGSDDHLVKLREQNEALVKDKQRSDKVLAELRQLNTMLIVKPREIARELTSELTEARAQLAANEEVMTQLKQKISETPDVKTTRHKEAIKGLETCVSRLKLQLVNDRDAYELQVNELKEQLLKASGDRDEAYSTIRVKMHELSEAQKELKSLSEVNAELKLLFVQMESSCAKQSARFCPICSVTHAELDSNGTPMMALISCGHVLCADCLAGQSQLRQVCPMCQTSFRMNDILKLFF
ncbi:hypothetical protein HDE_06488 [Halotydeus destructor]|nr:hypothetical protein HDE_06488 [Halotydeus destructor]